MLTIEPPFYSVAGTLVFRDDADADLFHVLPGAPRLAAGAGGRPRFTLFKYRRDLTDNPALDPTRARGGGLALFEVELPVARPELLAAEVARLSGRPDARLAPVLFRSGSVAALLAHAQGDSFVEDLAESHAAPIAPPHRAAFAVALTPEGATLFERAARGGDLPCGVAYDLRFLALTPSVHARVTMDYERIYDRFAASVGFTYYVSVKLDLDLAWLVENGFVKIEITAFTDAEDARRQQDLVMQLVKARLAADFFRSGIPPKPPQGAGGALAELLGGMMGGGEVTSASALFVIKARYEAVRETKHHEMILNGRTAVELPHAAAGLLSTLVAGDEQVELDVREIDLDDPFFSVLDVKVLSGIDFAALPELREAAVTLSKGEHTHTVLFTADAAAPGRFLVPLTDRREDLYSWKVEFHFDPRRGAGPLAIAAGPFASRARVLVAQPQDHVRLRRAFVARGPIDLAEVPRLHVHLRLPGEGGGEDLARAHLILNGVVQEADWRYREPWPAPLGSAAPLPPPRRLLARVDWEDPRGEVHEGEEEEVEGDVFIALGPFRGQLEVAVHPVADWQRIRQVLVELEFTEGDRRVERRLVFDADAKDPITWRVPLLDRDRRTYRWRETVFRIDGTARESDWAESDRTVLLVGHEPPTDRELRIVWVGTPSPETFGLRIDLWATDSQGEEQPTSTFLRSGEGEAKVRLPLDAGGGLTYRYEVRKLTAAGEELVREGEDRAGLLVVRG